MKGEPGNRLDSSFRGLGLTSVKTLSGVYCPPSYWIPAGLLWVCCLISAGLFLGSALLPVATWRIIELQWPDSDTDVLVATLGHCVVGGGDTPSVCLRQVGVPLTTLDTTVAALETLQQISYVFVLHTVCAALELVALLLFAIGMWLKLSCFCCFGRGNVPFFGMITLSFCCGLAAIASDIAFGVYAGKSELTVKINTMPLVAISLAFALNITGWINGAVVFLRLRQWAYEDEPDWLENDPAPSAGLPAMEESPDRHYQMHKSLPPPPVPVRTYDDSPLDFGSDDPIASSDESTYMDQRNHFSSPRPRSATKRPAAPQMYLAGQARPNFKAPPVYPASSRYSKSTFYPTNTTE